MRTILAFGARMLLAAAAALISALPALAEVRPFPPTVSAI
jgi:hypothetical protein